jgi:hypothetical protein
MAKASKPTKKISKQQAEKALAWRINEQHGFPKGLVAKLLTELEAGSAIIEKAKARSIPYTMTEEE